MYDQRAHRQDAPLGDDALDGGSFARETMDGFVHQNAKAVRPRQDAKGTVVRSRLVQMDPDGDDSAHWPKPARGPSEGRPSSTTGPNPELQSALRVGAPC